jgi:hypothetical protein
VTLAVYFLKKKKKKMTLGLLFVVWDDRGMQVETPLLDSDPMAPSHQLFVQIPHAAGHNLKKDPTLPFIREQVT